MCEAVSEETRIFKKEDYRYYSWRTVDKLTRNCRVKATLDPASSTEQHACYRAIVVNAVDTQNNWFIVDVPFGRWDSALLIDKIFDTVKKWDLTEFGIEKGIFKQVLEPFIYKEMSQRQVFFNIIPLEHAKRGTKLERIKLLQPRFKAHTIWFPDNAEWLSEMETELAGVTKDEIKSLYIDLVDALAMQEQIAERPMFRNRKGKNLPRLADSEAQLM
jgi:predicted phage terminase large subunit-like protein